VEFEVDFSGAKL